MRKPTSVWTDFDVTDLCCLLKSVGIIGQNPPIFLVTGFLTATVPFQLFTKN